MKDTKIISEGKIILEGKGTKQLVKTNKQTKKGLFMLILTCKNERSHAGDEAGQEAVERKCANQQAIKKLESAREQDVQQIRVYQL